MVFVNPPALPYLKDVKNVSSYARYQVANAINHMDKAIKNHSTVLRKSKNQFMLKATLAVSEAKVDVDMIPSADNVEEEGKYYWKNRYFLEFQDYNAIVLL